MIEIPLNSNPEQLFSVSVNSLTYDIRVVLNSRTTVWTISLSQEGVSIVEGVALLSGIDIAVQYTLPFENVYVVNLDNSKQDASADNLGTVARLFILTDEEVQSVETV
jgi:hypothetical protein